MLKEGQKCPVCYDVLRRIERTDYRSEDTKKKFPLSKSQRFVLNCRCLHPGDLTIGGFF